MANGHEVFDSIDRDRNGVIDRQEFSEFTNTQPNPAHDTGLMHVIAQRLGTLEASMVRFIEENERENNDLKGMLAAERQSRLATEAKMWSKMEAMQADAQRPTKEAPMSSKAVRECVQDNMRLKDQVEHLSKQVATVTRAHRQGRSSSDSSLQQFESRVEERFEQESNKVAELETKLQCTVEALQLLNSQSEHPQSDENTSSELVRLEAWIAEEAMQRRRLQERLSGMGVMESPQAGRSMSSPYNNGRNSPAMSEASDDTWAGLESTLKSIEGGPLKHVAPPAQIKLQRGAGEARVNLLETAVRELTDQVAAVMHQREASSRTDTTTSAAPAAASSELVKRLERLERKLINQRSAEHTNAEFERVREAIETVNRVQTLRLEKIDRQLMTVKRRSTSGGNDDRASAATAASLQQQQQQLLELKTKVEIVAQATAARAASSGSLRSASKERKPENEGKPKLMDRVTYLESQCDGIEVALRGCLEEVASVVAKGASQESQSAAQMQQMQLHSENAESDSQQLSLVISNVEELAGEVKSLKVREEEKANGMLLMVDQLEKKVESLDQLPGLLTARFEESMTAAQSGQNVPPSVDSVQINKVEASVKSLQLAITDQQQKCQKSEASLVELSDRVTCLETVGEAELVIKPVRGDDREVHCYDNPARSQLHPDHLTNHTAAMLQGDHSTHHDAAREQPTIPLTPPSPPIVSKRSHRGGAAQQWAGGHSEHELGRSHHKSHHDSDLHEPPRPDSAARRRSSSRRSSSRRPREVPREVDDAENVDPREYTPHKSAGRSSGYREWEILEEDVDSPSPDRWNKPPRLAKSPQQGSPEYKHHSKDNSKETLRDQLSAMMSGVNDLSDKYKGGDPVQHAAQAMLLASQKRSSSSQEPQSSVVHSNPLATTVFDSIDVNKDGIIDRTEFRKAYNQANGLANMANGAQPQMQTQVVLPSPAHQSESSVSRQMLGTPPLPARPSRASNEYLELRKKLLNSGN